MTTNTNTIVTRAAMDALAGEIKAQHVRIGELRASAPTSTGPEPLRPEPEHQAIRDAEARRSWLSDVMHIAREVDTWSERGQEIAEGLRLSDLAAPHDRLLAVALDGSAADMDRAQAVWALREIRSAAHQAYAARDLPDGPRGWGRHARRRVEGIVAL